MFKIQTDTISNEKIALAFIKSLNIQAFPCGRRRSTLLSDLSSRIPFDPEARLNTEANNRKHSSLNGFTQTYLDSWDKDNNKLTVALAGYLFNIDLDAKYVDKQRFGDSFASALTPSADNLYVNILIEDTPLFQGEPKAYTTGVLSSLATTDDESALDIIIEDKPTKESTSIKDIKDDYYFSALAVSSAPLSHVVRTKCSAEGQEVPNFSTRDDFSYTVENDAATIKKRVVSLHLLEKVDGTWQIHEPARLPHIEHGDTEDSIVVKDITAGKFTAAEVGVESLDAKIATVSEAAIENLEADNILVHNDSSTAAVTTDILNADKVVTKKAEVEILDADQVLQGGNKMPVIKLAESDGKYQLQITL